VCARRGTKEKKKGQGAGVLLQRGNGFLVSRRRKKESGAFPEGKEINLRSGGNAQEKKESSNLSIFIRGRNRELNPEGRAIEQKKKLFATTNSYFTLNGGKGPGPGCSLTKIPRRESGREGGGKGCGPSIL